MLKAASFISRFWIRYHWSHTLQFNQPLSATHNKNMLSGIEPVEMHILAYPFASCRFPSRPS
jgi:hypothetical protein